VLEVQDLEKTFPRAWRRPPIRALRGLSLSVAGGEVVALTGPNGSGKSTLLRILATTVLPDGGRASVCGLDVVKEPHRVRARVGLARGDSNSLYGRLTLRDNLLFFAGLRGLTGSAAREATADALASVGLSDVAPRRASALSSGMACRAVLARALLGAPGVLLVDEVERSVDDEGRSRLLTVARRAAEDGAVVLWATHDREVVEAADREVRLREGRTVPAAS